MTEVAAAAGAVDFGPEHAEAGVALFLALLEKELFGTATQFAPSPVAFIARHHGKDSPQAVVFVDRDGVVRYVVRAGPNAELPSNAEILRRLDAQCRLASTSLGGFLASCGF